MSEEDDEFYSPSPPLISPVTTAEQLTHNVGSSKSTIFNATANLEAGSKVVDGNCDSNNDDDDEDDDDASHNDGCDSDSEIDIIIERKAGAPPNPSSQRFAHTETVKSEFSRTPSGQFQRGVTTPIASTQTSTTYTVGVADPETTTHSLNSGNAGASSTPANTISTTTTTTATAALATVTAASTPTTSCTIKPNVTSHATTEPNGGRYPEVRTSTIDVNAVPIWKPANKPITEVDIDADLVNHSKPWRLPGANQADYFNYGFDEFTWTTYCLKQQAMATNLAEQKAETQKFEMLFGGSITDLSNSAAAAGSGPVKNLLGATGQQPMGSKPAGPAPGPGLGMGNMGYFMEMGVGPDDQMMQQMMAQLMAHGITDPSQLDFGTFMQQMQQMPGPPGVPSGGANIPPPMDANQPKGNWDGMPNMDMNAAKGRGRRW